MKTLLLFGILSIPVIIVSWRTLFNIHSHGFYRFFSWECILWLFASNYRYWFVNPWDIEQLISWVLLIIGGCVVIAGVVQMKKAGKAAKTREDKNLYGFEKTTELVDSGIFKVIRHPLYGSLVYLTWGIFLKNPTLPLLFVSFLSSVFLYITARLDEKECLAYFGDSYQEYMKRSKMFVPYVF
jgi:protein-S-isoprenylcysteine O-methyltransferase Ste14